MNFKRSLVASWSPTLQGLGWSSFFYAVILLGVLERLLLALTPVSFWFDEVVSVAIARMPILQSWEYLRYDNSPPLYYWLLHAWGTLWGFGEVPSRLLSFILSLAVMGATYLLGKHFFNHRTGLIAAAIFSISPMAIFYTNEARMYALLWLFFLLLMYFFVSLLAAPQPRFSTLAVFTVLLTAALYTHLTTLSLLAVGFVFLIYRRRWDRAARQTIAGAALAVALFGPWLVLFIQQKSVLSKGLFQQSWYFSHLSAVPEIFSLLFKSFANFHSVPVNLIYSSLLIVLLFFALFRRGEAWPLPGFRRTPGAFALDIHEPKTMFCLLAVIVPTIVSSLTFNTTAPHYYLVSFIGLYLLLAKGAAVLMEKSRRVLVISLFVVSGAAVYSVYIVMLNTQLRGWRETAQFVAANHPDTIVVDAMGIALNYYLHPTSIPVVVLTSSRLSWQVGQEALNPLQYSILYNQFYLQPRRSDLVEFDEKVKRIVNTSAQRIVYIFYYNYNASQPLFALASFRQQGWHCVDVIRPDPREIYQVVVLDRQAPTVFNPRCAFLFVPFETGDPGSSGSSL